MRLFIFSLFFFALNACGDGKVELNAERGERSELNLSGSTEVDVNNAEARDFFEENLYPIMKETSGKGCAANGCHANDDSQDEGFYIVDSDSFDQSWEYAKY